MRRVLGGAALLLLVVAGVAVWGLRMTLVPEPALPGQLVSGALESDGRSRTWRAYLPARRASAPALVFVLHGSGGDGPQARAGYGYDFDQLAEEADLIPVYPDGFEGHWNDCRRAAPYSANTQNVDDLAFFRALTDELAAAHGADRTRVFATGISNGGQMALRLALEAPDLVRAVAPVAAGLPAERNMDCRPAGRPVSVLIMNGTSDPMNPYEGGDVALYGILGNRGPVLSSEASIDYFRELGAYTEPGAARTLPDLDPDDGSQVETLSWRAAGKPSVALYTIRNGGHNAPHPQLTIPRLLGPTNHDISAAREIWTFFSSAP